MEYKGGRMMIRVAFIPPIKFLSLSHYGDIYMKHRYVNIRNIFNFSEVLKVTKY